MRIVCLFDLNQTVRQDAYETWAKSTDLSPVRGIDSINDFQVISSAGVLSSDEQTPHEYIEVIDVADKDRICDDFADSPTVVLTEDIE